MKVRHVPLSDVLPVIRARQEEDARRAAIMSLDVMDQFLYGQSVWIIDRRRWWRRLWHAVKEIGW